MKLLLRNAGMNLTAVLIMLLKVEIEHAANRLCYHDFSSALRRLRSSRIHSSNYHWTLEGDMCRSEMHTLQHALRNPPCCETTLDSSRTRKQPFVHCFARENAYRFLASISFPPFTSRKWKLICRPLLAATIPHWLKAVRYLLLQPRGGLSLVRSHKSCKR